MFGHAGDDGAVGELGFEEGRKPVRQAVQAEGIGKRALEKNMTTFFKNAFHLRQNWGQIFFRQVEEDGARIDGVERSIFKRQFLER